MNPELIHGLPAAYIEKMADRFDAFLPQMASVHGQARTRISEMLPEGAGLTPQTGRGMVGAMRRSASTMPGGTSLSNGVSTTLQRPYQPEFESPDRQQYPIHHVMANRYWRLFYKLDPVIGNAIDLYSELPWGEFELTGQGVDGEVRDGFDYMCELTQVQSRLPHFVREYLVLGEVGIHNYYSESDQVWSHIAVYNPDHLKITDVPFLPMEPIVEFVPDQNLRELVSSDNPALQQVREQLPPELFARLRARQNIPLSPLNFTFIPRKLHDYDVRGTSLLSRMWRILMYEDAIFNASIATARRHAGPLKIAKLGDPSVGYIPTPEQQAKVLEMLAQSELDVNAWLVFHYGINFEMVGTTERVMTIDKHWDMIERVKLVALGLSKAFLHGEVTYASASQGLTVFLKRLRALRNMIVTSWMRPKFFLPVAKMNKWIRPTEAELAHKVRVRRSHRELLEDQRYIVPEIEWANKLDPSMDSDRLNAMSTLASTFGLRFSETTLYSMVGRNFEEEAEQVVADHERKQEIYKDHPDLIAPPAAVGGGAPGGLGMGSEMPGLDFGDGGEVPPPMEGEPPADMGVEMGAASSEEPEDIETQDWSRWETADLLRVLSGEEPEEEPWTRFWNDELRLADSIDERWDILREGLLREDYPTRMVEELEAALASHKVLSRATEAQLLGMIDDSDSDKFVL